MYNHSTKGLDATPCQPRADQDHIAPYVYGSFIHFDYLRQRLSREFSTSSGNSVAPEKLESVFPPHIIEALRDIDWATSDQPIAFGLLSRLCWIWTLRFHQLEKRLHVSGDGYLYDQVSSAFFAQILNSPSSGPLYESAHTLVPRRMPEADNDDYHHERAQRDIRQNLESMLRHVAIVARENGIDHRPFYVDAVLYQYDSRFYAYLRQVRDVVATHGSWTGAGIREYDGFSGEDYDANATRKGSSILRFRRRKKRTGSLGLAIFATKRIQALWHAFDTTSASSQPSEQEQTVFRFERGVLSSVLASSTSYQHLCYRMDLLIPRFLQHFAGSRSIGEIPHPPLERIQYFIEELNRAALQFDEPGNVDGNIVNLSDWYSEKQLERYSSMFRQIGTRPSDNQALASGQSIRPTIDADKHDVKSSEIASPTPIRESSVPPPTPVTRSSPKVSLDYEVAVQLWWDLADKLLVRKPTQKEFCDYLAVQGFHIAVRTLSDRCREWRQQGHPWPGAQPGKDAETA